VTTDSEKSSAAGIEIWLPEDFFVCTIKVRTMTRNELPCLYNFWVKSIAIVVLFFVVSFQAGCSHDPGFSGRPDTGVETTGSLWPHNGSDLDPDPAIVFGSLPNGFRYVIMENREPVNRVSMHLNIQAGSLNEFDGEEGTAHFLEHMLFNGSTHFKPGELVKYFQRIGMQFGPDANAHTGFEETVYDIFLADNTPQSIAEGLTVLSDYARGALLLQSEVDRERPVILAEKRTRDSVAYRTWIATVKFEMPDTRIPYRMPIGTEESIVSADNSSLRDFYDAWYRPGKMMVVIVGDIQVDAVEQMIAKTFAPVRIRGGKRQAPLFGNISHLGDKSFYHFEKEAGKTSVSIETLREAEPFSDNSAYRRGRLIEELANKILRNRLDARVGKQGTPYTSGSAGSGVFLNKVKYADISAESSPENWDRTLVAIEALLRQALVFGFEEPELERVIKDYMAELDHAVKNAPTRQSPALARRIIRKVNSDKVVLSPLQEKQIVSGILSKTTLAQVNSAFRDIWSADHRLILVTGNADLNAAGSNPEKLILDLYNKSRDAAVEKPPAAVDVRFPYFAVPEKTGTITGATPIADLGILQIDFANGVLVNLKQTDFEADQIVVTVRFGKGRFSEPADMPGLGPFTESVVNESALGSMDKDTLERALAGKNLRVDFNVKEDSFYFSGYCVKAEIETLFQLLYAHLTDPGFRQEALLFSKEKFNQRYLTLEKSVNGALTLSGIRFLAGGDGRFGLPARKSIESMSLEDVAGWIKPVISNAPLEVSVVGDFDMQAVRGFVSRYFGSLPARTGLGETVPRALPAFPEGRTLNARIRTRLPKGLTVVAYPTTDMWDIKRTRRLAVLSEVISERLRVNIREKLGAAYSTAAFNRPGRAYKGYGLLMTYVQVAPGKVPLIRNAVRQAIEAIVSGGITEDELKRALDPTLSGIRDARRRNSYWLNTVLAGSRQHPVQLQWSRGILEDYAAITVPEIEALAKKYLVESRAADILVTSLEEP
jgi:zinc protease